MIGTWKQQFLAAATQAFESDATSNAEQERIAELERMVGKLTMELEIAKKASSLLDGLRWANPKRMATLSG
jgi:transposase